jgi:Ion channel
MPLRRSDRPTPDQTFPQRLHRWHNRLREPALTAMLITQVALVVLGAPYAAAGYHRLAVTYDFFRLLIGFLTALISRGRIVTGVAIVGVVFILSGNVLEFIVPSVFTAQLTHSGTIVGSIVVGLVVGRAVLAPGPITAHRVLGAIVLYLNFGLIAAAIYRVIWDFHPAAFHGITPDATPAQATGALIYYSFVTLTTVGYGDITPANAFARGIANLEAIVGQLYPATTLARFVTLELEARRR